MAQPKPKKKRRSRSDPIRREAAARREETRRQASEERRRAAAATARRKRLLKTARRVGVPTVIGIAVVVAAIFVFRPQRELAGVAQLDSRQIITEAGYALSDPIDVAALPAPACGVFAEPLASGEQAYSDLYNGAVVLWHRPGDEATAGALAAAAAAHPSHVVVAPLEGLTDTVHAVSWGHRKAFTAVDEDLAEFIDVYRRRGRARADCPLPGD